MKISPGEMRPWGSAATPTTNGCRACADQVSYAVEARHLHRIYNKGWRFSRQRRSIVAVEDVSFAVPRGTIFGLLGPNGAGKTTIIKMLSTLLIPTSGTALVGGHDVVREERLVRWQLGVVLGGDRGLYAKLSAWDNLVLFGNLYGMTAESIRRRAAEMLALVDLADRARERVEGFSRGMKQRLHLAKALLHDPPILILDEPTIGLDPAAAVELRRAIADLAPRHTVLLTTHDMNEADQLCREIAIVDRGLIVAQGTPAALKERVAAERRVVVSLGFAPGHDWSAVEERLARLSGVRAVRAQANTSGGVDVTLRCAETAATLDAALAILRAGGTPLSGLQVIEPTLEDAFLAIAGRSLE
jgi:ABC-2 type transport system ATP-binding protein